MKILLACSQYPPMKTGYARVADRLSAWFTRFGHDVDVVTDGRGCSRTGKVAFLDHSGKKRFSERPDIVHVIGPTPFFSEQCVKYARHVKLPVLYHLNAFPDLSSFHNYPGYSFIEWLYKQLNLYRTLRHVDLVVFNTYDFADYCSSFYDGPFEVIPNGFDSDRINGSAERQAIAHNRVLFVGQLRRYKGLPYLLRAIRRLRDDGRDVVVDVVGEGPERERIRSLVAKLSLRDAVFLHGQLSDKELDRMYDSSRVIVLPSLRGESFGIVLLEAAARGVPVMASDLPGVREIVKLLGGATFPPKNSNALAHALGSLLDNPLASSPRKFPTDKFLWNQIARAYLKCYERVTGLDFETQPPNQKVDETTQLELVQ